jgi:hypothetical protein
VRDGGVALAVMGTSMRTPLVMTTSISRPASTSMTGKVFSAS